MLYDATLNAIHRAITTGETGLAESLVRPKPRLTPHDQLVIYSGAYRIRLAQVVQSDYPALVAYLGQSKMAELVEGFVSAVTPASYNLDFYPFGFWRFLQDTSLPLPARELAALEGAIAETFMLPGSAPLSIETLARIPPDHLVGTVFHMRIASRLLWFDTDVEGYMQAHKRGENPALIGAEPNYLLVYRHRNEVKRRRLAAGEYELLHAIGTGATFGDALDIAVSRMGNGADEFSQQVMAWLPAWLSEGFFAAAVTEWPDSANTSHAGH